MDFVITTYYQLISLALANLKVANSANQQPRPYPRLRAKGHFEAAQLLRDNAVKCGLIKDSELPDASFRDLLCSVGLLDNQADPIHSSPFAAHRHHLLRCWGGNNSLSARS